MAVPWAETRVPHVYLVGADDVLDRLKIGWTGTSTISRMRSLQTGSPVQLVVMFTIPGTRELEQDMHARFAEHRVIGEWFRVGGELAEFFRECFRVGLKRLEAKDQAAAQARSVKDVAAAMGAVGAGGAA